MSETHILLIILLAFAAIGFVTCLWLIGRLVLFILRPLFRLLFVSPQQRVVEDAINRINRTSEAYLRERL